MTTFHDVVLSPVGIFLGVLAVLFGSLASCAVAELAVRMSAYLYSNDPQVSEIRREEWLRQIEEMKPLERVGEAGSILWIGLKRAPGRLAVSFKAARQRSRTPRILAPLVAIASIAAATVTADPVVAIVVGNTGVAIAIVVFARRDFESDLRALLSRRH